MLYSLAKIVGRINLGGSIPFKKPSSDWVAGVAAVQVDPVPGPEVGGGESPRNYRGAGVHPPGGPDPLQGNGALTLTQEF